MELTDALKPLLNRLLSDDDFRRRFMDDPAKAAGELGLTLDEQETAFLCSSNNLRVLSEILEERISPSGCMVIPWGSPP